MSKLLAALAAYVPPDVTREALAGQLTLQEDARYRRFPAAVLFADVSGFTPLTEALAKKGTEGPEELTRLLNTYFTRMISLIEAEGGEVVKFSGDAVTVVFPTRTETETLSTATRHAKQAAEAMQGAMGEFSTLETSVGSVALGMKIGIGAGDVLAAEVGGRRGRWEYVIAGDPLRQVAEAEHQAERGDIILSPEADAIIADEMLPPQPFVHPNWSNIAQPQAVAADLRCFVPGAIIKRLEDGLDHWIAELRPMSILFIGIGGLAYEQPDGIDLLHTFLGQAQDVIYRYEGSINKVAVDDKGTIMIALFGAPPFAHEDDAERALRASMDLQNTAKTLGLRLTIGVTTGRVFSGPVGSETRREYTVMGDTVNLAARFMSTAGVGQIRCDYETYRSAQQRLAFEILPPIRVKGKAGLLRIYRPLGEASLTERLDGQSGLIGRQAEIEQFTNLLAQVQDNPSRAYCFLVEGEAGIGKSRLVQEMIQVMREKGLTGLIGMGRSIEQQTPYRAWRDIFNSYFDLDDVEDLAERRRRVTEQVQDIVPDQMDRLPLLDDMLALGIPENDLTRSLSTQLRHESLVLLLLSLLRAWAAERPLILILEDAHWLDSLSWDLAIQVMRTLNTARASLLLIPVMRPLENEAMRIEPTILASMDETSRMVLDTLPPEDTLVLAATRLGLPRNGLPDAVANLVQDRAGGNPFFAEELVYALRDNQLIVIDQSADEPRCIIKGNLNQALNTLPETIEGIILSRIDRLPADEQLALKVAAVIGRTFAFAALRDTLGKHMEITNRVLTRYLDDLVHLDLTPIEAPEPELIYIFKHIITQEVAYQTLLFAQRRELHDTVAQWYEQNFLVEFILNDITPEEGIESPAAPYFPLLTYHWHQAENPQKEHYYATLAGYWAAAQFANQEAIGYLTRALELTPQSDLAARYDLLLTREAVQGRLGERESQSEDLDALTTLTDQLQDASRRAEVILRQANYLEVTSDYNSALASAHQVIGLAKQIPDPAREAEGNVILGKVLWRQGNYEAARDPLNQSLMLARTIPNQRVEANSLYYLGHVHLYQDDYPTSRKYYTQALDMYRANNHRQGEADSLNILGVTYYELGNYSTARDYWEQTLSINQMIGDSHGEALTLVNLGVLYCDLGDYEQSRDYHEQGLNIRLRIDDLWGKAASFVNLGLVYHNLADNVMARKYCEQALQIQKEIGDKHGQGYSLTYFGHALAGLDELALATEAYDEAKQIRRSTGQESLAIDDLAGLARIAFKQNTPSKALAYTKEILSWLEEKGTDGIEYPLQVQLTCYQVLSAVEGDSSATNQAHTILNQAHTMLMEQANNISDQALRSKFLENVETNRQIRAYWQALNLQ